MRKFKKAFSTIGRPAGRPMQGTRLLEVLVISLAAVICGAASCAGDCGVRTVEAGAVAAFFWTWSMASRATTRFSRVFRLPRACKLSNGAFRQFMAAFRQG